jgi:hypothetical protein
MNLTSRTLLCAHVLRAPIESDSLNRAFAEIGGGAVAEISARAERFYAHLDPGFNIDDVVTFREARRCDFFALRSVEVNILGSLILAEFLKGCILARSFHRRHFPTVAEDDWASRIAVLDCREIVVAQSIEITAETARPRFKRFGRNNDEIVSAIPAENEIGRFEDSPVAHFLDDETGDDRRDFCPLNLQRSRVEINGVVFRAQNDLLTPKNGCDLVSYNLF